MDAKNFEIKLEFKNYKALKSEKFDFTGSNLYLVQGINNLGKTSVTSAIRDLLNVSNEVPNPITNGEVFGEVVGTLPGPDGSYTIRMEIGPKETKWTAVGPNNRVITKVKDLRELLKYNSVSVNDFIHLSKSAEGRRKQVELVSTLLPDDKKIEFNNLLQAVEPNKGKLFVERKNAKSLYEQAESNLRILPAKVDINTTELEDKIKNLESKKAELVKDNQANADLLTQLNISLGTIENNLNNRLNKDDSEREEFIRLKAEYERIGNRLTEISKSCKEFAIEKETIKKVLSDWKKQHPNAVIQGHKDFPKVAKACPSFEAKNEYKNIGNEA